jgi:sugar/nucleoside kinase (ribokinase family)
LNQLELVSPGSSKSICVAEDGNTSYTIVISPPGTDRIFLHSPGCNDTFGSEDLNVSSYPSASHFHFGYPPLMARMYRDEGAELQAIFRAAKEAGLSTSLDLSLPDPTSASGLANWPLILKKVLPLVDYFLPSVQELSFMLSSSDRDSLFSACAEMGAGTVVLKDGNVGLHARHADRDFFEPCFEVEVAGTTGSGDASIAGFLYGIVQNWSIEECLVAATAVGACCVEAPDAISGIRTWEETLQRIKAGWPKLDT